MKAFGLMVWNSAPSDFAWGSLLFVFVCLVVYEMKTEISTNRMIRLHRKSMK